MTPSTLCADESQNQPNVSLDGPYVVLTSGVGLGIFDRANSEPSAATVRPFALYRDAALAGGPFAGRLYVTRRGGLYALTIGNRHEPRFDRLIAGGAKAFAVAGLRDRLYVSNENQTIAFDAISLAKHATFGLGCKRLRALVRMGRSDVVQCDEGAGKGVIAALPLE